MNSTINVNKANNDRELRRVRRDIMKDHPGMSTDEATRLAQQRTQHGRDSNATTEQQAIPDYNDDTTENKIPARKKKTAKKATAKTPTKKQQKPAPAPIHKHVANRVHTWNKQEHSTASLSVGKSIETVGSMVAEAKRKVSKAFQQTTPEEEAPLEMAPITVEQVQRLGTHISTTTLSSFTWNARAVCATTLIKTGIEVFHAIQYRGLWNVIVNPWNRFELSAWMQITYFAGFSAATWLLPVYAAHYPTQAVYLALACLVAKAGADWLNLVLLHGLSYSLVYGWAMYHQGCLLKTAKLGESGLGNGKVKAGKVEKLALRTVQANNKLCLSLALILTGELVYHMIMKVTC